MRPLGLRCAELTDSLRELGFGVDGLRECHARLKGAASLERAAEKILAMLREPEYVRLGAYELPDNPGRLCIPAKALREWARSSPAGDGPAA